MLKNNLIKVLNCDIDLIGEMDLSEDSFPENEVQVFPHHLKNVLNLYLNNDVGANDLNAWANFLLLRTEYISPGDPFNDELMDYYETMWYVIQRLSTPELDGEITKERVKGYLLELQKYND